MIPNKNLHFIGVGGSGMSALAQIASSTHRVTGSDRSWPKQSQLEIFKKLEKQHIELVPQDGSGITEQTEKVIYSTAIEPKNPDVVQANLHAVPLVHRADFLAHLVQNKKSIAVGGTSGKSTITGMIGVILDQLKLSPTVINGGEIINFQSQTHIGNAKAGKGEFFVMESDESDGSIKKFFPYLSVIANISKDHKTMEELCSLFLQFANQTEKILVLNNDCPEVKKIKWPGKNVFAYSLGDKADFSATHIQLTAAGSTFSVNKVSFELKVPGKHNVSNALAAIATCAALGLNLNQIAEALKTFKGIKRRLEPIPSQNGKKVFDDFAHNPEKIEASLNTILPLAKKKCWIIFQPHGYSPTQFLFNEYVDVFTKQIRAQDTLILLPIFDAGGTAKRDISSNDLAQAIIQKKQRKVLALEERDSLLRMLKSAFKEEEVVLVMGARDPSLTELCHKIASF